MSQQKEVHKDATRTLLRSHAQEKTVLQTAMEKERQRQRVALLQRMHARQRTASPDEDAAERQESHHRHRPASSSRSPAAEALRQELDAALDRRDRDGFLHLAQQLAATMVTVRGGTPSAEEEDVGADLHPEPPAGTAAEVGDGTDSPPLTPDGPGVGGGAGSPSYPGGEVLPGPRPATPVPEQPPQPPVPPQPQEAEQAEEAEDDEAGLEEVLFSADHRQWRDTLTVRQDGKFWRSGRGRGWEEGSPTCGRWHMCVHPSVPCPPRPPAATPRLPCAPERSHVTFIIFRAGGGGPRRRSAGVGLS
jgi:hypothetical protein